MSVASFSAAKPVTLKSPDGRIVVSYSDFKYSIEADGQQILSPSVISVKLQDGTVYGGGAKLRKVSRTSNDAIISAINYKRDRIQDKYNQIILSYTDFDIEFRAYDEGVAYRFISKSKDKICVKCERAEFNFPADFKSVVGYSNGNRSTGNIMDQTPNSFESLYETVPVSGWAKDRIAFLPVVFEASNGYKIAITEANLFQYPGMFLFNSDSDCGVSAFHANCPDIVRQGGYHNLQGEILSRKDYIAEDCDPGFVFPWRIIQIAREDMELAASDMVYKLAKPAEDKDWSWAKPGKVAWDWWNDWNISGVDFKSGINTTTYKHYIDFASANGIEYVILDEGWAVTGVADLTQIVPEIDLGEIVAYAGSKNVGIILWAGYWAVNRNIEETFRHFSSMGVKGFKIDFMDRDDQQMVGFYNECARMGAKYGMLVDFHGAYKPTGLQRTYPNVLNFEGVFGLEQMKWSKHLTQPDYDVTIPFVRMVAGPMDYTQGAMRNATKTNFCPVYNEPMSQGTRCHQLAEYIVFDAPFTMLCDSPSSYCMEKECTGLIASFPTVWDETIPVNGKIGEYITLARRSGENWYAGALTNWDERDMVIDLSFLPAGNYTAHIYRDGVNADKIAKDYAHESMPVTSESKINIHLAPGGGWLAVISKN